MPSRAQELRTLLLHFAGLPVPTYLSELHSSYRGFARLLVLNDQLQTPKNLCIDCWCFVNLQQSLDHINRLRHRIVYQDRFRDIESFIEVARNASLENLPGRDVTPRFRVDDQMRVWFQAPSVIVKTRANEGVQNAPA